MHLAQVAVDPVFRVCEKQRKTPARTQKKPVTLITAGSEAIATTLSGWLTTLGDSAACCV